MQVLIDYLTATGISQAKLAQRIGVDRSTINNWIKGKRVPNADTLDLISARTGISRKRLQDAVK